MSIIIEGHDATGKSTLALYLATSLGIERSAIVESEGPARSSDEINKRCSRYSQIAGPQTIFVRHPCVSNPIYDVMRGIQDKPIYQIDPNIFKQFYNANHLFVYCDPGTVRQHHHPKHGEDPDHVAGIERYYDTILDMYREWAVNRANFIYRIGDDQRRVLKLVLP